MLNPLEPTSIDSYSFVVIPEVPASEEEVLHLMADRLAESQETFTDGCLLGEVRYENPFTGACWMLRAVCEPDEIRTHYKWFWGVTSRNPSHDMEELTDARYSTPARCDRNLASWVSITLNGAEGICTLKVTTN
jgi:hypothetical protein